MRSLFRLLGPVAAGSLVVLFWAPGCANQGEGDRCDRALNGDQDCEPPLVCIPKAELNSGDADRCCPQSGTPTDDRCLPATPGTKHDAGPDVVSESSDDAVSDTSADSADAVSEEASGQTCTYSSQCPGTLVCGPTGVCQPQCLTPKDCASGQVCNPTTNTCELAPVPDAGGD